MSPPSSILPKPPARSGSAKRVTLASGKLGSRNEKGHLTPQMVSQRKDDWKRRDDGLRLSAMGLRIRKTLYPFEAGHQGPSQAGLECPSGSFQFEVDEHCGEH